MSTSIIFKRLILFVFPILFFMLSCKKDTEYDDHTPMITLDAAIPDTLFYGESATIRFIAKGLDNADLTIAPESNPNTPVLSENITNESNAYIFSKEFVVPEDGSWSGNYLINVKFKGVEQSKPVYFTIPTPKNYFLVGGSSVVGWEPTLGIMFNKYQTTINGKQLILHEHYGYFTSDGYGLKITPTNLGWDGNFGKSPDISGVLVSTDSENIPVPEDGFYRLVLNMNDSKNRTYSLEKSTWSLIETNSNGQVVAEKEMLPDQPSKGRYTWSVTTNLAAGTTFRFRENKNIQTTLGSSGNETLTYGGENISINESGNYRVVLDLNPGGYRYSLSEQ